MSSIPLLHIIFYLATLFLPNDTAKFTVSSGYEQKVTWVRQAHGAWHATTDTGKDAGVWSVSGLAVSVVDRGTTNQTDLSKFIKVEDRAGQKKQALLGGRAVSTTLAAASITLSQDKDENAILFKPVVITYSAK